MKSGYILCLVIRAARTPYPGYQMPRHLLDVEHPTQTSGFGGLADKYLRTGQRPRQPLTR